MMHIACAADDRYAPYCAAMLHSLFSQHRQAALCVHYLHPPEFSPGLKGGLASLAQAHGCQMQFHVVEDDRVAGLPPLRGILRLPWYRIFLPELLPELDRVLYLDADTLITAPLNALWQTDISRDHLAAVLNVIAPGLEYHLADLGLPNEARYFNSGVMLLNLSAWRRDRCVDQLFAACERAGKQFWWSDQDAMNMVFTDSCLLLHPRWNCQTSLFITPKAKQVFGAAVVAEAIASPAIVHFEGPDGLKPWNFFCSHPFKRRYRRHLRACGLPVPRPEDFTVRNLLRHYSGWAWLRYRYKLPALRLP